MDAKSRERFAKWLSKEMPPATVIADPKWWAARILIFFDNRDVNGEAAIERVQGHLSSAFKQITADEVEIAALTRKVNALETMLRIYLKV